MDQKKIFILGASMLQRPAILKAKEKGLYVYALDYDSHAVAIPDADEFLCISTIDKDAVLAAALKYKPDYIITSTSDMPVRTVAWVNEQLGREQQNRIAYEDAICATDKAAMRRRMKECGVPIPEFHVIDMEEEFLRAAGEMPDRFILKPADNAASRGVVCVDKTTNPDLKEIYAFTKQFSRSGEVLVEELMTGPEVSVESFTVDGEPHIITITDKMVTPLPFFVETGHTEPSRLPEEQQEDIRRVAIAAIKALHVHSGPNHTEIKVTPTGAKLVEIAARLGGDFITSKLVPLSTGVDMIDCGISETIGEEVHWQRTMDRGSAIRYIMAEPGTITEVAGADEAALMPGVQEVVLYKNTGDTVPPLESSGDRVGHVVATGKDAGEAAANAEQAVAAIRVRTEIFEQGSEFYKDDIAGSAVGMDLHKLLAVPSGGDVRFLRCGRDAIGFAAEDILASGGITENQCVVFMPALCCDSMEEPFRVHGLKVRYYPIHADLTIDEAALCEMIRSVSCVPIILTMNFFDVADVRTINAALKAEFPKAVIVEDVTHLLLQPELYDTSAADYQVGSIRKWFGIPDGAFIRKNHGQLLASAAVGTTAFTDCRREALALHASYMESYDQNIKKTYRGLFGEAEDSLDNGLTPHLISAESDETIRNVDTERIHTRRRENYHALYRTLASSEWNGKFFRLTKEAGSDITPFMLPVVLDVDAMREQAGKKENKEITRDGFERQVAAHGVYVPVLWPITDEAKTVSPAAADFSDHMLAFWIDHRYTTADMEKAGTIFLQCFEEL